MKCLVFLFAFFALFADLASAEWIKYGSWEYNTEEPATVECHINNIDSCLSGAISHLFETDLKLRTGRIQWLEQECELLNRKVIKGFPDLKCIANFHYKKTLFNIKEYVDPRQLPPNLAWRFALLLPLYGNFQKKAPQNVDKEWSEFDWEKETSNFVMSITPRMTYDTYSKVLYAYIDYFEPDTDLEKLGEGFHSNQHLEENEKLLNYYKTSLLFFSYCLGISENSPPILHHTDLETIAYDPDLNLEFESFLEQELFANEEAWVRAMRNLGQQHLEDVCNVFRSFYTLLLQNRDSLSQAHISLAIHLNGIITKLLLSAQRNVNNNLDAANPWMFRLYIDQKKWEILKHDETFPKVQQQCLRLLPPGFNLEDIAEENESEICKLVRMRNLLPTNKEDLAKGEEIVEEFAFSFHEMRANFIDIMNFLDDRVRFARGAQVFFSLSDQVTQQIYNYLSGYIELNDMSMTEDNVLKYLLQVKLFDRLVEAWNTGYDVEIDIATYHYAFRSNNQFYFPRTTFELRKRILKLYPYLKSYEALTVSLNPDKILDAKDQMDPGSWMEESERDRQLCIDELLKNAQYLYEMKKQSPLSNLIVGTRGISASGKSTFLKRNIIPLILSEGDSRVEELSQGILNMDTIKAALKKLQGGILNTQVHEEASTAFQKFFREFADKGSYILDMRQLTPYDVMISLIEPAKKNNNAVWLFDLDISLSASFSRILSRPLHGIDPCPEYQALIDGYLLARRHRYQVLELVVSEESVAAYELYATSKQKLIASKEDGELWVYDSDLFDECIKEPTLEEIEKETSRVIDDAFIAEAVAGGDIGEEDRGSLEKWRGLTLREAVQRHVQGQTK